MDICDLSWAKLSEYYYLMDFICPLMSMIDPQFGVQWITKLTGYGF